MPDQMPSPSPELRPVRPADNVRPHSASPTLHLVHLKQLIGLAADASQVDGIPLTPGALPPPFLIRSSIQALERGEEPIWCSFFLIVRERQHGAVGAGGFRGPPDSGRVEIGYHVAEAYRGLGIATSAVQGLLSRAFVRPEVDEVFAETSIDNLGSRRVVEKAGFHHVGRRVSPDDGPVDQWLRRR